MSNQITDSLEYLAREMGYVVKYDAAGNPSYFVEFFKCKSSDLDSSLPDHVHPAFRHGPNTEDDSILIGAYMGSELEPNGTLYSLPLRPPRVNITYDDARTRMNAFDVKTTGLTIADHGLILLTAKKYGWVPKGNNNWSVDYRDGTPWETGKAVTTGVKRVFRGWMYECLQAHTTSAALLPDASPLHWKKGEKVGGTPVASQYSADNQYRGYNTLTGSGPVSWTLGGKPGGLVDIQGNAFEQVYGYRLVNLELQIIPDNEVADPACDQSDSSSKWRAIKPGTTADDYTLVAPGTEGTLHWTWANNKITLDTVEPTLDGQSRGTSFKDYAVNAANVQAVPSILYELGIMPLPGDTTQGYGYYYFSASVRVPRRGGSYNYEGSAGLGVLYCGSTRSVAAANYGLRPRSRR